MSDPMLSLPTPPGTSHRTEKENRRASISRVAWSDDNQYRIITSSPPAKLSAVATSSRAGPSKSILKKTPYAIYPIVDEFQRETTPEPSDPLADLHYLDHPVEQVIAQDVSLRDSIQAYSIIAARLRAAVTDTTDADASWPLFQPLRKHGQAFVDAMVRDLGQVFIDPLATPSLDDSFIDPCLRDGTNFNSLPSPKESPKKKKGMSAEQVKRARDLSGVCHAVLRLLGLLFTVPALCQLFTDKQLDTILTHVLAVPLANELPSPNARKTCALAIWLLQTQRLPAEVLHAAKDRIAYALRRGIEGELGREGKKGSTSDGLKAVHDLALYQPAIFVPAFATLLPVILKQLLAPTLALRSQSCHALGGYALALSQLPPSEVHTVVSQAVVSQLTKAPDTSSKKLASPSKDSVLVRTLRTTLQATEPKFVAQGPVWAFSVIASLIVLLGPTVFVHEEVQRTVSALFVLGFRHSKSSVRTLGTLAWRAMAWAFFRPPHVKISDDEDDEDDNSEWADERSEPTEEDLAEERRIHAARKNACWKFFCSVVDMGAGVGTIGAVLGQEETDDESVARALKVLRGMSQKGGPMCKDAMDVACRLVQFENEGKDWDHQRLLPPGLFSSSPGLLTVDYKTLATPVRAIVAQCPEVEDIRPLTRDEISTDAVFNALLAVWRDALSVLRLSWGSEEIPDEIRKIWFNLLKANVVNLQEAEDERGIAQFARRAIDVLVSILKDDKLDFTFRPEESDQIPTSPVKKPSSPAKAPRPAQEPLPVSRWNYAVKLFLVRDLYTVMRAVFPEAAMVAPSEQLLAFLTRKEALLLGDVAAADEVRQQWALLCAEAVFTCDTPTLEAFFETARTEREWSTEVRTVVWQSFVEKWSDTVKHWESAVVLLCAPFGESDSQDMSDDMLEAWDIFLKTAIDSALDYGIDAVALIDQVASTIATHHGPSSTSAASVVDLLLSNLDIAEARQVPTDVLEFANDTLNSSYPPAPRHKVTCMWMIRSLTRMIDACPVEFALQTLELVQEGLCTWLADDYEICSMAEYAMDILPLYQTALLSIQSLPRSVGTIEALASLLEAPFVGRIDKHSGTAEAFHEFWETAYSEYPEPSSGWPAKVHKCLDAVARAQELEEASVEAMTMCGVDDMSDPIPIPDEVEPAVDAQEDPESEEEETSFEIPSPATLTRISAAPLLLLSPDECPSSPTLVPATPKSSPRTLDLLTTPSRPQKSTIKVGHIEAFRPTTPTSPSFNALPRAGFTTPKRTPVAQSRRVSGNKENLSPRLLPAFASVADRIGMRSPALIESILGKRSADALEDDAQDVKAFKKGRMEHSPATLFAEKLRGHSALLDNIVPVAPLDLQVNVVHIDTPDVFKELPTNVLPLAGVVKLQQVELRKDIPNVPVTAEAPSDEETEDAAASDADSDTTVLVAEQAPLRKRKGVFLEAVEVPTLERVRRMARRATGGLAGPSLSLDSAEATARKRRQSNAEASEKTLRRTRSATKMLDVADTDFQRLSYSPKRRRTSRSRDRGSDAEEAEDVPVRSSSPFHSFGDCLIVGSDDSIMHSSDGFELPQSDDDPHLGQVTPHRLVSPALRRVKRMEFNSSSSDLPSDDSNMSASPSRERVARKRARLSSESELERLTPRPNPLRRQLLEEFSSPSLDSDL